MNEFEPLSPLIGREKEQAMFLKLLDNAPSDKVFLLAIWGQGGIGKTRLLEHFAFLAEQRRCKQAGIIDLYLTPNQRVFYLTDNLMTALGRDAFTDFLRTREDYYRTKESTTDKRVLEPKLLKMQAESYFAFNQISKNQRVVLFFDTFEVVQDRKVGKFLLYELLPHLHNFLVVISGRTRIEATIPNVEMQSLELKSLDIHDACDYLNSYELKMSEKEAEEIWLLSGGRPILLSLTIDWLKETSDISNIANITPEDFEASLVSRIRTLDKPEHEAILFMAHAFHRFDASLLTYLSGQDGAECEALLTRLSRLSFIKHKPPQKFCMLHDEMRDLVIKHVWNSLDASRESRRSLSQKIIKYYATLIENCATLIENREQYNQRMVYVTEQMYHRVYADPDQGINHFLAVFDSTLEISRLGYCDMLIKEVRTLFYLLNDTQKALVEFSRSRLLYQSGDMAQAKMIATTILNSSDVELSVREKVQTWLDKVTHTKSGIVK